MTKFIKIELTNYRPYFGKHVISFSTKDEKPISVIQMGTGIGKTSILNAITWCLYGEEKHKMKGPNEGILNELAGDKLREGDSINVEVAIYLGDKEPDYIFKRSVSFIKRNNEIRILPVTLKEQAITKDVRNNPLTIDGPDSRIPVRRIFPEEIQHLFIFDGEQLDKFFLRDTYENVKDAIIDITQIEFLDSTIKHLHDVSRNYSKENQYYNPKINDLTDAISNWEKNLSYKRTELSEAKINSSRAQDELKKVNEKLKGVNVKEARELVIEKERLEKELDTINGKIQGVSIESFEHLLDVIPYVFCKEPIMQAINLIDQKYESGELPSDIKEDFVRKLLDKKKRCICGADLKIGTVARKHVEEYLSQTPLSKYEDKIRHGQNKLSSIITDIKHSGSQRKEFYEKLKDLEIQKDRANTTIDRINQRMKKIPNEKIKTLGSQQELLQNEVARYYQSIGTIEKEIEQIREKIAEHTDLLRKEEIKATKNSEMKERLIICQNSIEVLRKLREELINELREAIQNKTNELFLKSLGKSEAAKRYKNVVITENYECKILNEKGQNILDQLSAGQREILALCFMVALRQESGFDSPIIIDTPIARIDENVRYETLTNMLEILQDIQVSFLMIPQVELSDSVLKVLKPKLGQLLTLKHIKNQGTKVVENE